MTKLKNWLRGKKTYGTAFAVGLIAMLRSLGYEIPDGTLEMLGSLALIFLRSGIKNTEK